MSAGAQHRYPPKGGGDGAWQQVTFKSAEHSDEGINSTDSIWAGQVEFPRALESTPGTSGTERRSFSKQPHPPTKN